MHLNAIRFSLKYRKLRTIAAVFGTRISNGRRMAGCRIAAVRILEVQMQSISPRVHYSITSARHRVLVPLLIRLANMIPFQA